MVIIYNTKIKMSPVSVFCWFTCSCVNVCNHMEAGFRPVVTKFDLKPVMSRVSTYIVHGIVVTDIEM